MLEAMQQLPRKHQQLRLTHLLPHLLLSVHQIKSQTLMMKPRPKSPLAQDAKPAPSLRLNQPSTATVANEGPRASNDPRKKPKPVSKVEISTERPPAAKPAPAKPSEPVAAAPAAKASEAAPRASNDPRKKRNAEKAQAKSTQNEAPAAPVNKESAEKAPKA